MPTHPTSARTTRTIPAPADWGALLAEPPSAERRPPGDGWMTAQEIAEQQGSTHQSVRRRLRPLMAQGRVEAWRGTQHTPLGPRIQVWYRPVA
jgi:hypothetical protein